MSADASMERPSNVLELPITWLASLFQHVASGPGGLDNAAALSQTCKPFHDMSESSAVTYCNLHAPDYIDSPEHPFWQWLAKQKGLVAGLKVGVVLVGPGRQEEVKAEQPAWERVLQTLSSIPDLHLTVRWVHGRVSSWEHPYLSQWLEQYGHLIGQLDARVNINTEGLQARAFCAAAASCRSMRLHAVVSVESLDLSRFAPISTSLIDLDMSGADKDNGLSLGSLTCFTQLTSLSLCYLKLTNQDLWTPLAALRGLTHLSLEVTASGDPSPLSALTGLCSLCLQSYTSLEDGAVPFSFSSLQPLSTMQQLEVLNLKDCWEGTSFEGLAGLSKLTEFMVESNPNLQSLNGLSTAIRVLDLDHAPDLASLSGIQGLMALERLCLCLCGVASLEPLAGLSSLSQLRVHNCPVTSLEGLGGSLRTSLQDLLLYSLECLCDLSGVERLSALQVLTVMLCPVTSVQPVAELNSGLKILRIRECEEIQEEVLELPNMLPTAGVEFNNSNVQEVVLAGGVRRAVGFYDMSLPG